MKYQFIRQEPIGDKLLFVLSIDKKKMKEHILIGSEHQICSALNGNTDTRLFCDAVRPLGNFLTDFESDPDGCWNLYGLMPLYNALHSNRWKQPDLEKEAADFLSARYETLNPVSMYAALRTWNGYLTAREYRDRNAASGRFLAMAGSLTAPFHDDPPLSFDKDTGKPKRLTLSSRVLGRIPTADTRLDLWYPDNRNMKTECVAAYESFYPLLIYYTNRLADWGLTFSRCKICGKIFLAKSQRYELCSDKCRKAQSLQNKRDYDKRAKENSYDLLYKNECQNWRNKINRAKRTPGYPSAKLEEAQTAFTAFRKEALQRKSLIRQQKTSPQEFMDWLYQQSSVIIELLERSS